MKKFIISMALMLGMSSQANAQGLFDLLFGSPKDKTPPMAKIYKDGAANVLQMDRKRTLEVIGVVGGSAISQVAEKIEKLSRTDQKKPIYLFINSPGGSVGAGTAVLDAMAVAKRRGVRLICASGVMAASMGYIILAACDERYTLRSTKLLFHPMSISVRGARVKELRPYLNAISQEERRLSAATRRAMGMGGKEYYRHYFAETMWPAAVLHKRVPEFFTIVEDITGTDNLFVYKKPGFSLFGGKKKSNSNPYINLPAIERLNQ